MPLQGGLDLDGSIVQKLGTFGGLCWPKLVLIDDAEGNSKKIGVLHMKSDCRRKCVVPKLSCIKSALKKSGGVKNIVGLLSIRKVDPCFAS